MNISKRYRSYSNVFDRTSFSIANAMKGFVEWRKVASFCLFTIWKAIQIFANISEVFDWILTFSSIVIHIKCLPCGTWLEDHGSIYEVEFSRRFRRNSFWSCVEDTRSYIVWLLAPKMSGVFNSKIFRVYRLYRCFPTLGSPFDGKNQYWNSGWNCYYGETFLAF